MGDRSCAKEKSSGVENGSTRDAIDMFLTVIDSVLLAGIVLAVLSLLVKYHALAAFRKLPGPRPRPTASFSFLEMHGSFQAGPKVSKLSSICTGSPHKLCDLSNMYYNFSGNVWD